MTSVDDDPQDQSPGFAGRKLANRVALVTGGTRGIGAAICTSLASQGARVAAGYSGNAERAKAFAAGFEHRFGAPVRLTVHQGNVAAPEDCQRVVEEVIAQHGRLDILVNNAGVTVDKLAVDLTTADWDKVIAVNLSGAFHMAQAALRHMLERGTGRIINVSSLSGETGNIGQANYAASPASAAGRAHRLVASCLPDRVDPVAGLVPAGTRTPHQQRVDRQRRRAAHRRHPGCLHRPGV